MGETDLEGFGLDLPEGEWLARLRSVRPVSVPERLGSFEVLEEVARGAQGVVYRARQSATQRLVALKRLHGGALSAPAPRVRFEREVEAEAALHHPNIVSVYGIEIVDGQPLLAMEWIDGVPVDRWCTLELGPRLELFLKIAGAVHHAHQRGVVHRDLKPSNILVDPAGEPHVVDFGLAKFLRPRAGDGPPLTGTRDFLGTPSYAAPEQVRGEHEAVDVRTDVYALGVVLYEMLTGRNPFQERQDLGALLDAIRHEEPLRPSSVARGLDRDLDAILLRALAKDQDGRYASVDAFASDVRRYLAGEPVEARGAAFGYVLRKQFRRHRVPAAIATAFLVLLTTGLLVSLHLWRRVDETAVRERRERLQAEAVMSLIEQMLGGAHAHRSLGRNFTVRRLLDSFVPGLWPRRSRSGGSTPRPIGSSPRACTTGVPCSTTVEIMREPRAYSGRRWRFAADWARPTPRPRTCKARSPRC